MKKDNNKIMNSTVKNINLAALMSNLPGMVYRCKNDEDWTMEFVSDGCLDLTGFPPEALIDNAYISYAGLIHPEDRYSVWKGVNEGIENSWPFKLTYRIVANGGQEKWVFEQGQGIFDESNILYAIEGFITDISEQKNAERRLSESLKDKSLLLSEIHHRVKNNFQLIISMLELQKSSAPGGNRDVFNAAIERIRVFSDMHQDLYNFDKRDVINFSNHIRNNFKNLLLAFHNSVDNIDLELEMSDVYLDFDTAIPLGLMINEMISNSLKHAISEQGGWIKILIEKDSEDEIKRISYSDSGRDMGKSSGGFGLVLLEAMALQLGLETRLIPQGHVKYEFTG